LVAAKHMLRYLKAILDHGLWYISDHEFGLYGYSDLDWADSIPNWKRNSMLDKLGGWLSLVSLISHLKQERTGLEYEGYQMLDEGLLTYRNRLYIPSCDDLKRFIMDKLHKRPYIGH
jgi:hypothetical protein